MKRRGLTYYGLGSSALSAIFLAGMINPAQAQVGSGWTQYFPTKTIQLRGPGAKYNNSGGIETFSTQPGDERSEARVHDDYRSGQRQFEGYVRVRAGANGTSVHQVFKFLMIVAYNVAGGELRQHSYQHLGTTGVYGRWVRVNTIHNASAGTAEIYINGSRKGTMRGTWTGGPNGFYHKYGVYNGSQFRPQAEWRNIKYFRK